MDFSTTAIHARPPLSGPLAPPIQPSTTYERGPAGDYPHGYSYIRSANPNRVAVEQTLAALEGGAGAAAFASGMAAAAAVMMTLAAGDHVIAPRAAYHGTRNLLAKVMARWRLATTFVDMGDLAAVAAALRPSTRLIWIETPSNPTMLLTDIAAVAALAHAKGALVVVDNTVATPLWQRPLEHGADVVMHSTTKYIGGHSDVMGGCVVAREDGLWLAQLREVQVLCGGVPAPFDSWLVERGLKTLACRMTAQSAGAQAVAEYLTTVPQVTAVHHTGLATHPQAALARRQMRGAGALLAFEVEGGAPAALAVAAACTLIRRATSLGGVESLIEHRHSIEGPDTTTPPGLLRLSVGLESPRDLIADLAAAFSAAARSRA